MLQFLLINYYNYISLYIKGFEHVIFISVVHSVEFLDNPTLTIN